MFKIITHKLFFISLVLALPIFLFGCSNDPTNNPMNFQRNNDILDGNSLISGIELSELSEEEKNGLIKMREEEKLARDVYITLGEKRGNQVFFNISKSEQTHTDAVKNILERYSIQDPVIDDTIGSFTSVDMQTLYQTLVEQGNKSLSDALIVCATVEDLDIKDLNDLLLQTDNQDIILVYNNLLRGSKNHLNAYVRNITNQGSSYTPQYISQSEYDEIVSSQVMMGNAGMNDGWRGTGRNGKNR